MDYCNITPNTLKYIFIGFKNTTRVAKCSGYLDSRHRKLGRQNSIKNELRQDVSQLILAIELYCLRISMIKYIVFVSISNRAGYL